MLSAYNISKTIGGQEVLRDVSLTLQPGEVMGIVGPSGAGKTSLLRALSFIEPPDSGIVEVDGQSGGIFPKLTVVFQQLFIWPHLTIRENLTLPLRSTVDEEHFDTLVKLFKMSEYLDKYPNQVSIGERQRAALVRALLLKPKYLLLDEVTSALDIEQSYLILGHLKQIAGGGVGIIFVTHALHFARSISDKIIFLDNGEVVEEGDGSILEHPKTKRLDDFINAATVNH